MPFSARQGFTAFSSGGQSRRTGAASTNVSYSIVALPTAGIGTTGPPVTNTSIKKFGTASGYFEYRDIPGGAGSRLNWNVNFPNPAATFTNFGLGDFTIEWWQYIPTLSGHTLDCVVQRAGNSVGIRLAQQYETNGLSSANPKYLNIFLPGVADLDYWDISTNGGSDWQINQWYFCALQRKSAVMSFWLNGSLKTRSNGPGGQSAATRDFPGLSSFQILLDSEGAQPIYIDELCWSNSWRYQDPAAAIRVPTAPFTVDVYTGLLMHMDGSNGGTSFPNATS